MIKVVAYKINKNDINLYNTIADTKISVEDKMYAKLIFHQYI